MKKITRLLALFVVLFCTSGVYAVQVPSYFVNETFDGISALPTGWSDGTPNYFGYSGATTIGSNVLNVSGSGSGSRGKRNNFTSSGSETSVYINFDLLVNSWTLGYKNAFGLVIDGSGSNTANPKNILCLYATGSDGKFHYANADLDTVAFTSDDTWGASFRRAGTTAALTNSLNLGTQIDFAFTLGVTYNVRALLNFTDQKVDSLIITKLSDNSKISLGSYPFMRYVAPITDVNSVSIFNSRGTNEGNGASVNINASVDNFKTYKMIEASLANITINYLDPTDNPIQSARISADNVTGSTYTALAEDKATIVSGGFYYVYDAASTTSDNVVVLEDGSAVINLKFTKTVSTTGTYTWTGVTNGYWNESELNFSTDGSNSLGYQNGNGVVFDGTGANKTITLNNDFNLGSNDVTVSSDGYSISGIGKLTGSGTTILNTAAGESVTLAIVNELTGGVVVNGGTVVIAKDAAATKLTVASGSTLNLSTGSTFNKAIEGAGTITVIPTSNVGYSSAITGIDAINYSLVSAGAASTAGAFSGMPTLNNSFGGMINVNTSVGDATLFGSTNQFTNNKLNLGDNVSLVYPTNPATDGSTAIVIGELSGSSLSTVMGPRLRTLTYNLGGLNTNSTFAGTFENFPADAWSNIPVLNIVKAGSGTLTLSGASTAYIAGAVTVSTGKLDVTGTLGTTSVPVTVAADATLSGTGIIGGATAVNGILEGALSFGSTLALAGTTNLVVNGFEAGQFDAVTIAGALTCGGTLNITVNASAPAVDTSIKLFDAGTFAGAFATVNLPSNYTFNSATGMLTYTVGTDLNSENASKLRIYPTLTNGLVTVEGFNASTLELVNLTGQVVKQVDLVNGKATISMNGLSNGAYFVKVRLMDGSVKVQKVIYQK
jgi:autotransporter-associated beta strand protein